MISNLAGLISSLSRWLTFSGLQSSGTGIARVFSCMLKMNWKFHRHLNLNISKTELITLLPPPAKPPPASVPHLWQWHCLPPPVTQARDAAGLPGSSLSLSPSSLSQLRSVGSNLLPYQAFSKCNSSLLTCFAPRNFSLSFSLVISCLDSSATVLTGVLASSSSFCRSFSRTDTRMIFQNHKSEHVTSLLEFL